MSESHFRWIIRNDKGQIRGPYTMPQVLKYISEGHLTGEEFIAKYPDGEWSQISRDPEFYDKILESIEKQITPKPPPEELDETVFMPPPKYTDHKKKQELEVQKISEKAILDSEEKLRARLEEEAKIADAHARAAKPSGPAAQVKRLSLVPSSGSSVPEVPAAKQTLDLTDVGELEKKAVRRKAQPLFFALLGIIVFLCYLIFSSSEKTSDKISLLIPQKSGTALTEPQAREKTTQAIVDIQNDTFENYVDAQNKLVSVVEGAPSNLDARGLLCYVYKELWPYAKQDAADQRALAQISQTTRVLNVAHPAGNYCEAVKLYSTGRFKEARGTVDGILDIADNFSLLPVVYEFKAEILEADKDMTNSIPYYEKAAQYWDQWLKPKVTLGFALAKINRGPQASESLQKVLQKNPKHKLARIGLGLIQYKLFKQTEASLTTLSEAVENKSKVPATIESEANVVLAQILFEKGDKSKAISKAEIGYSLNPASEEAKKTCARVGCSDRIKTSAPNKEMEVLCDQFARSGDFLAAQAECKAAFELEPKNGSAAMKAGKYLWALNQSYEAIEWLKKAIKAEPKLISAHVMLADYMSQRYDFQNTAQVLNIANRMAPNNYEVLRGMALLEFRKNNLIGAINYGVRALRIFDGDIDTYVILSRASRLFAQSLTGPKDGEKREAAARDAIRYATKAVELDATNSDAQIAYAEMLAATSGIDTGITYLKEVIKKYSHSYEYRVALGDLLRGEERFTQAKEIYEQVALQDPKNKKALVGLGLSQRALGLNDQALKTFFAAAILDPTDAEPLFFAGQLYQEKGTSEGANKAISQFKRALQVNYYYPKIHYSLGRTALMVGDLDSALKESQEEKKLNPNVVDSYILAAETLSAKRLYSECASEYSIAIKLRPQGADIYVRAAQCYRQSGSVDIAQDMLDLATAQESGYPDIYKEQGAISQLKRENSAAILAYCKYLKLSPNALDRNEVENWVTKLGGNSSCE